MHIDIDATLVIDHSDAKAGATPTWKKSFGHHPLLAFLDRPEIAGGEALAGLLRTGNAGSNTASDHVIVLHQALAALPAPWRPDPSRGDDPDRPKVLVRCDTAGATHRFAEACYAAGVGFSFGYPVDWRVQDAVDTLNLAEGWYPAIEGTGGIRDGAWVAEATTLVNLSSWPPGTRLILRKERPHPGAQLRFTDADGMRVTAFITDTEPGVVAGQVAGLELRHRQHARVEDRIRELKNTGPTQPALPRFLGQRRLAGNRPGRRRPGHLDPAHRIHRPPRHGPRRDRHLPLPGPARGRPHHPQRPPTAITPRYHLAVGRPDRGRLAHHPHRLRITDNPTDQPTTKGPLALGSPPRPATRDQPTTPGDRRTHLTAHLAAKPHHHHLGRKIEAR